MSNSDEKYFGQRKAGPRPSKKAEECEELISFVEDGLNRGQKVSRGISVIAQLTTDQTFILSSSQNQLLDHDGL